MSTANWDVNLWFWSPCPNLAGVCPACRKRPRPLAGGIHACACADHLWRRSPWHRDVWDVGFWDMAASG
jgi:hypothetical protein